MKKPLYILSLLLFFSCSDVGIEFSDGEVNNGGNNGNGNNGNTSEIYFTFNYHERTIFRDNWIIIHDENGNLLDYSRFEEGQELIFEKESSLVTDKISITLFEYSDVFPGNKTFNLSTTLQVDKGSVWDEEVFTPFYSNPVGNFDLTLSNFPQIIGLFVSNENRLVSSGDFTGTEIGTSGIYNYTTPTMDLFPENEYFITFIEDSQDFKYQFIEDVENGDLIDVDYSDFQFFDEYLSVDLPSDVFYELNVRGIEDYQDLNEYEGYVLSKAYYQYDGFMNEFLDQNPIRIGYLDRFENYQTNLKIVEESYYYQYKKIGEKPIQISIPNKPTIDLFDTTISNFDFSIDISYQDYLAGWESEMGTYGVDFISQNWEVNSLYNSPYVLGELPLQILQLYQDFDKSILVFNGIKLQLNENEELKYFY